MVINAIRKEAADQEAMTGLDYERDLWKEKEIKSVANITRKDVHEFLALAAQHQLLPAYTVYPFERANDALYDLKRGVGEGAKLLVI